MAVNYDGRRFYGVVNSTTAETGQTLFAYRQEAEILSGSYSGGKIRAGLLLGKVLPSSDLDYGYQQVNEAGELQVGHCRARLEVLPDGRYRLHEAWRWLVGGQGTGTSIAEQLP